MRILCTTELGEEARRMLKSEFPDVEIATETDRSKYPELLPEAEVVYGGLRREDIERARKLRWWQYGGAGVDHLPLRELARAGVTLTNASGMAAPSMAEYCMGMMLNFSCKFYLHFRNASQGRDTRDVYGKFELCGKSLGILGLGHVGRELAKRAKAFEMRVVGLRKHPQPYEHADEVVGPEKLEELLRQSDFVVSTLPLTPETRHFLREEHFKMMKATAYFINVGRAGTVQEDKLIEAVEKGTIAGAGLDVYEWRGAPPSPDSKLFTVPNICITPHISGASRDPQLHERRVELFMENVRRFVKGERLMNVVDLDAGY